MNTQHEALVRMGELLNEACNEVLHIVDVSQGTDPETEVVTHRNRDMLNILERGLMGQLDIFPTRQHQHAHLKANMSPMSDARWTAMVQEARDVQYGMYDEAGSFLKQYLAEHKQELEKMSFEQLYHFILAIL